MIRRNLTPYLERVARQFPIVTVTGPRQSGKTTLCKSVFPRKAYVSLEALDTRTYAQNDPRAFLNEFKEGAVIDEVQRVPELLSYLQEEVDENPEFGRFVLTGSANLALLESVSQSLAGRTAILTLLPFGRDEYARFKGIKSDLWQAVWQGGYPAIPDRKIDPVEWFAAYVETYLERDVRRIINITDLLSFQTFLSLAAARSGQLLNLSELGNDASVTHNTVKSWVSVLEASYIAYRLRPFYANMGKRLIKTPKLYFYDTGLVCFLLGIRSPKELRLHPLRGAIFESWVVSEILKSRLHRGVRERLHYFRDQKGNEVDLLVQRGETTIAVEIKSGETISNDYFKNLSWLLSQEKLPFRDTVEGVVVYGGAKTQKRTISAVLPWHRVPEYNWGRAG